MKRWKFTSLSFSDRTLESKYKEFVWLRNKRLIRFMTLLFLAFWVYNLIYSYVVSHVQPDTYANLSRWVFYTPLTFLILLLAFRNPLDNRFKRTIWYFALSIYSILFGLSTTLKTALCIVGTVTSNCSPSDRPTLQNTDFYAIIGPFIILLVCLNDRRWELAAIIVYIAVYIVAIIVAGLASTFLTFVPFVILVGGYALALAISWIQENQTRLRFKLRYDLENEVNVRREAQRKQEVAEKEKDAFASYIFHEIRVPLNVIKLSMNLLDRDRLFSQHLDQEGSDLYTKMKIGINSMESVLNDTVDYETLSKGGYVRITDAAFNLLQAFNSMLWIMESQWAEKNIQLIKEFDNLRNLRYKVIGDENRLRQMTNNYLSNAVKFTPVGGTITLSVQLERESDDDVQIYVSVIDTGIGITLENQHKLFKPFVQIDPQKTQGGKGSGLGLSIVAKILDLLGGTYGVESEVGKGSTFWYRVRLKKSDELLESSKTSVGDAAKSYHNGSLYILVVDDNQITRELVCRIFEKLGHITDSGVDGQDCVEKCEENRKSEGRKYDVIFIDNLMPRMKGIEAIRWLREHGYTLPIVSFTATADTSEKQDLLNTGADYVLSKPSSITDIEQTLGALQQKKRIAFGD